MYTLVEISGKQYKAEVGKELKVDLVKSEIGQALEYTSVLAVVDGENVRFGTPYVDGVSVKLTHLSDMKDKKVKVYKFRRRKGYRRTQGHRQQYSVLKVESINA